MFPRSHLFAAASALGVAIVAAAGFTSGGRAPRAPLAVAPSDSFAHARHTKVPCLSCHLSPMQAKLTFTPPEGCKSCHHSEPEKKDCTSCHQRDRLPATIDHTVLVAAAGHPSRERTVKFRHARHSDLACLACHGQPVTMLPVDSAATCTGCHAQHHAAGRQCALCHRTDKILAMHDAQPVDVHTGCNSCHGNAKIEPLYPSRSFCLACHPAAVDHHPGHECTVCHMQTTPDEYRERLFWPPDTVRLKKLPADSVSLPRSR